jgi:hypothetical protein
MGGHVGGIVLDVDARIDDQERDLAVVQTLEPTELAVVPMTDEDEPLEVREADQALGEGDDVLVGARDLSKPGC